MLSKYLRYFLLTTFVVMLLASISMVGARANGEVEQPGDPTPIVDKATRQGHQPRILVEQSLAPNATGGPDAYGYEWNDGLAYGWFDIASPDAEVVFSSSDDAISAAKTIGFSFPFYEKSYSSVYISTNGLLAFATADANSPSNQPLPFIEQPQAVIAPLWDDLAVGGANAGKVYAKQFSATRFIVSYVDVTKLGSADTLTFQVILDANGTITIQYESLNGTLDSATVGIEDHDGVVGLAYLHNSDMSGLVHKAVVFTRPANTDHRPKALPLYQGAFTVNGLLNLDLNITNAGDEEQPFDLDLSVQNSGPPWQVQLFDAADTLITQTPVLIPGAEYPITVKFVAPEGAEVGETATVNLSVKSSIDSNAVWTVKMQSTVPASFVQALKDSGDIDLRAISKLGQRKITVFPLYTGSTMGVQSLDEATFMMYWERNGNSGFVKWTDIEQAVVDDFGQDILNATKITNNSALASSSQNVFATEPVSAITSDGNVGIVWVQRIDRQADNKSQYNIYMTVLNADDTTQFVEAPFSVTQNNGWVGLGDLNIPRYSSPRITATPNNTFFISWTDERQQATGTESNIGIAAFKSTGDPGNPVLGAQLYSKLSSVPDVTLYRFSTVYGLASNRIVLGYSSYDNATKIYTPGYAVLNTNGGTISDPVLLPGVDGQFPVVSQLVTGSIIYAWTKTETDNGTTISSQIAYVLIDRDLYTAGPHWELSTPDGLQGDYVSITPDENGNAVFTWVDTDIERKLYYALVDASGSLVTPAMSFYEVESGKALLVNQSGRGNAFYIYRFGVYLPITVR